MAQLVKNLPAMWKTWVQSLGWEDPVKKGTVTHSSILAWRIPCTEEPDRLQSLEESDTTEGLLYAHKYKYCSFPEIPNFHFGMNIFIYSQFARVFKVKTA